MEKKIRELSVNEIETVVGGAAVATATAANRLPKLPSIPMGTMNVPRLPTSAGLI